MVSPHDLQRRSTDPSHTPNARIEGLSKCVHRDLIGNKNLIAAFSFICPSGPGAADGESLRFEVHLSSWSYKWPDSYHSRRPIVSLSSACKRKYQELISIVIKVLCPASLSVCVSLFLHRCLCTHLMHVVGSQYRYVAVFAVRFVHFISQRLMYNSYHFIRHFLHSSAFVSDISSSFPILIGRWCTFIRLCHW